MSDYCHFPDDLKDIKYHIKSSKTFFNYKVRVFKENMNIYLLFLL